MYKSLFVFLILIGAAHAGQEIQYLGDGRFKCRGDNCEHYNAQQQQLNRINEEYARKSREKNAEKSRERMGYIYDQHERQWKNRQQ